MSDGGEAVRFIRKDGRIIPIRAPSGGDRVPGNRGIKPIKGALHAAGASLLVPAHGYAAHARKAVPFAKVGSAAARVQGGVSNFKRHGKIEAQPVKVHQGLNVLGLGLSVASGALAAATFAGGNKAFFGGLVASHGLDAAGIAANVASVSGSGHGDVKERAKQGARQEARNFAIGNAVFGVGLLGIKRNREALLSYAKTAAHYGKKALTFGRAALKVV